MAAAPLWAEVARGVLAIAQAVAIVIGGTWAYFKFVKGRTFAERVEVSVDVTPFEVSKLTGLKVRASMTNTGAAIVELPGDLQVVYLHGAAVADQAPGAHVDWGKHLAVVSVFKKHEWIEAQETVSDEVLVTIPGRWPAYRAELIVVSKKDKRWGAAAIVPAPTSRTEERDASRRSAVAGPDDYRGEGEDSPGQ